MRSIGRVGGSGAVGGTRGPGRAGTSGFQVPSGAAPEGAAPAAAAAGVAPLGLGLLALQEDEERARRDSQAQRRAEAVLEELDGLQLEMLGGGADPARLARLEALEAGEEGADPVLREAVRAVVLRARIEVARRGRGPSRSFA